MEEQNERDEEIKAVSLEIFLSTSCFNISGDRETVEGRAAGVQGYFLLL
jgi:hypothetical protein